MTAAQRIRHGIWQVGLLADSGIGTNVFDLHDPGSHISFKEPVLEILASTIQYQSSPEFPSRYGIHARYVGSGGMAYFSQSTMGMKTIYMGSKLMMMIGPQSGIVHHYSP